MFEPELRDDVRRVTEAWSATVAEAIRRGVDDGSIRSGIDPEQAAEVLITLVDGLCNRWLAGAMERERARELLVATLRRDAAGRRLSLAQPDRICSDHRRGLLPRPDQEEVPG